MQMTRPWAIVAMITALGGTTAIIAGTGVGAADDPASTGYVPIVPCRLFDTRPVPFNVGDRATPIGPTETHTQAVVGSVGDCGIPSDAIGVNINVTAVNGTADSFLTVSPSGGALPLASSLNWVAGAPPTPNQISVALANGAIDVYNEFGTVDVVGDVVGYSTTADLDALEAAIEQNDGEIVGLWDEFNGLDDTVSLKADLTDVYTREQISQLHAALPSFGGVIDGTSGDIKSSVVHFGTWTSTKAGTGQYRIDVANRAGNGCAGRPQPFVLVTAREPRIVSASPVSCETNGNWRFFVDTRNQALTLIDTDVAITAFG